MLIELTTATPRKHSTVVKTLRNHNLTPRAARRRNSEAQLSPSKGFTIRPRAFPCINWSSSQSNLRSKDPWLRAMHILRVGNRPDSSLCRDTQFDNVLRCLGELPEEGSQSEADI